MMPMAILAIALIRLNHTAITLALNQELFYKTIVLKNNAIILKRHFNIENVQLFNIISFLQRSVKLDLIRKKISYHKV